MEITVEISKDNLLKFIEEHRDEFSNEEKKRIIELLCQSARAYTDNDRLVANVTDLINIEKKRINFHRSSHRAKIKIPWKGVNASRTAAWNRMRRLFFN